MLFTVRSTVRLSHGFPLLKVGAVRTNTAFIRFASKKAKKQAKGPFIPKQLR